MRMKYGLALAALGVVFATAAVGQSDPIAARQALMKKNGQESRTAFLMAMGRQPFDATAAAAAMNALADDMKVLPTLFPAGSDQGNTKASPDIWTHMDDFTQRAAQLGTDATAAAAAAADGVDAFKIAFEAVNADCSGCHRLYRVR